MNHDTNLWAVFIAVVLVFASCGVAYHVVDTRPLQHKVVHLPSPAPSTPGPTP